MAVSQERIDELLDDMLENADNDGWCHIPEGLTEEEQDALSRQLAIITMQDRIDTLLEGILTVIKHMEMVKETVSEYDTMEKLKIKGGLETIKEDSQGLLMDLHSDDIVKDFFRIEMITNEDETSEEAEKAKAEMVGLIETDFKDQLEKIKKYCSAMIEMSDDVVVMLNS